MVNSSVRLVIRAVYQREHVVVVGAVYRLRFVAGPGNACRVAKHSSRADQRVDKSVGLFLGMQSVNGYPQPWSGDEPDWRNPNAVGLDQMTCEEFGIHFRGQYYRDHVGLAGRLETNFV